MDIVKLKWTVDRHDDMTAYNAEIDYTTISFRIITYAKPKVYCVTYGCKYIAKTKTLRAAKRLCQTIADAIEEAEK